MNRAVSMTTAVGAVLAVAGVTLARAPSEPTGQKTLAATMNVFVFPTEGQDAEQQSKDEAACYGWAADNTGTDPFDLARHAEQQAQQADAAKQQAQQVGQGTGAQGAVRGAAVGALIGAIGDDAGKGAAIGATTGLIAGRRRGRAAQQQATQSVEQQAAQTQAATAEQIENFKKAFAVCLEAKDYMVRF
jgi:hypothetical protein